MYIVLQAQEVVMERLVWIGCMLCWVYWTENYVFLYFIRYSCFCTFANQALVYSYWVVFHIMYLTQALGL